MSGHAQDKRAAPASPEPTRSPKIRRVEQGNTPRRGVGFSEYEITGLLTLLRARWMDGWDAVTEAHNQQFPGRVRSTTSLKTKFTSLYRAKTHAGMDDHVARAIATAKDVRAEMLGRRRAVRSGGALPADRVGSSAASVQEVQAQATDGEEVVSEPRVEPFRQQNANYLQITPAPAPAPVSSSDEAVGVEASRGQEGQERPSNDDNGVSEETSSRFDAALERVSALIQRAGLGLDAAGSSSRAVDDNLLRTVLLVLLESQHQRDVDREEERERQRRQEERRREEEREERRRRDEERAEERRRHDQFMQLMMILVANMTADQRQQDTTEN
ncbi:hypothetical protein BBJ28_00006727 [Nothophytophthora sp. Chile5]|nr:hypothetical protein BBJ28_00006727 [Nothophytophthora sp. Chile5]